MPTLSPSPTRAEAARTRKAIPAESRVLAETLAAAFFDDPVVGWVFPNPQRRRELVPACFEVEVAAGIGHNCAYATEALDGAAAWSPPEALERPEEEVAAFVGDYLRAAEECGDAVERLLGILDEHRPSDPHYSLELIGTHPESQGGGLGSALLAAGLARCDRDRVPAHLWSSNPRNVPFYERHGFEVVRTLTLPDGPPVWQMWREPDQRQDQAEVVVGAS
jgi:GNAT superfamily N-acetyltransferase